MTFSEEQVEWIVAEVLRRLGVAGEERSSSPVTELRVTQRVVTMRLIEGRLTGVKRIVVNRRAVITPAVKDELKHRKIELIEDSK
jgi:hypothetical protein